MTDQGQLYTKSRLQKRVLDMREYKIWRAIPIYNPRLARFSMQDALVKNQHLQQGWPQAAIEAWDAAIFVERFEGHRGGRAVAVLVINRRPQPWAGMTSFDLHQMGSSLNVLKCDSSAILTAAGSTLWIMWSP